MKRAFTLAEILVTVGVLGIVVALTIPNFIMSMAGNQMTKTARITQQQLTKVFQTSFASKYGTAENYPSFQSQEFYDELATFMPVKVKERSDFGARVDLPTPYWATIYGEKLYQGAVFELENGVILSFVTYQYADAMLSGKAMQIIMDVNGREKPNMEGKDIYRMLFNAAPYYDNYAYGKLVALGANLLDTEDVRKACYTGKSRVKFGADLYFTHTAGWAFNKPSNNSGFACLEYLNRINWDLRKYPVKDFTGDGE